MGLFSSRSDVGGRAPTREERRNHRDGMPGSRRGDAAEARRITAQREANERAARNAAKAEKARQDAARNVPSTRGGQVGRGKH